MLSSSGCIYPRGWIRSYENPIDGGLYERVLSIFINPPDFLSLLTMPRNQRLELESPHAGMVHLSRELDREVATFDKAREIMALIPAMRGG